MFNLLMALSPAGRYTSEDLWIRAIEAFTTGEPPNGKPISDLFRNYNHPIPSGARDSLAELFNPGEPPLYNVKLKPVRIEAKTKRKEAELFTKIMAVAHYDKLRRAGKSAIDARTEATEKYKWSCDESVFNRHMAKVHALLERVRCEDATGKNFGK